jgi:intein-encoded DNA endonuclease-like protein
VLIPDPKQQAAIREIMRLRAQGQTLMRIKSALATNCNIEISHQTIANLIARA